MYVIYFLFPSTSGHHPTNYCVNKARKICGKRSVRSRNPKSGNRNLTSICKHLNPCISLKNMNVSSSVLQPLVHAQKPGQMLMCLLIAIYRLCMGLMSPGKLVGPFGKYNSCAQTSCPKLAVLHKC